MQWRNMWARLVLVIVAGCGCEKGPDRWEAAQRETSQNPVAVSEDSVAGGEFNRFFPKVEKPWDIVYKQEKTGFAQASLQQDGREVAVLSVSDTTNNPEARAKFKNSEEKLDDMPLASVGEQSTAVLVNDRYQVQIRSMDPVFGPEERLEWLKKFNLQAIGRIH